MSLPYHEQKLLKDLDMIEEKLKALGGGHLTDKEFETLSVRITPAFYDIDLDGATNSKGDVLRKLRIIFNDIIDSRREAPSSKEKL